MIHSESGATSGSITCQLNDDYKASERRQFITSLSISTAAAITGDRI